MKRQYENICRKFTERYGRESFDSFAHFAAMKGCEYDRQKDFRMMLVGRSTNGWPSRSKGLTPEQFGDEMVRVFRDDEHHGFDWIDDNMTNREAYNLNRSRFWLYSGAVWDVLNRKLNSVPVELSEYGNRWFDFIAWSNLYKITEQGKTPGLAMTRLQAGECMEILREELDTYRPTLVLMEIDSSWFTAFSSLFSNIEVRGVNVVRITASYRGIPVIVTSRPETLRKYDFVTSVVSAVDYLMRQ